MSPSKHPPVSVNYSYVDVHTVHGAYVNKSTLCHSNPCTRGYPERPDTYTDVNQIDFDDLSRLVISEGAVTNSRVPSQDAAHRGGGCVLGGLALNTADLLARMQSI